MYRSWLEGCVKHWSHESETPYQPPPARQPSTPSLDSADVSMILDQRLLGVVAPAAPSVVVSPLMAQVARPFVNRTVSPALDAPATPLSSTVSPTQRLHEQDWTLDPMVADDDSSNHSAPPSQPASQGTAAATPVQQSTRRSGRSLKTEPKQEANAEPKAESKPQANNRKRSIESSPEDSNPSKRPKPLEPPPPTVASTATTTAAGTTTDSQAPPSRTRSKGASAASKAETTRSAPPVTKAPAQAMPTAVADDPSTLEMEDAMAVAAAPETRAASRVHKCFIVGGSAEDKQRSLNIIHELGCTYAGLTNESTREVTLIRRALCCYVACVDTYSDEYTAESTHLVLSEIKRTEKLLCTSAAGKWVIKPPYLYVRTATRSLSSQVSRKRTLDIAISYVERHAFMPTTHRSSSLSGIKMR